MRALRVAVVARSTFPLHGLGGLERHVFDLVQYLANAGVDVTLITRPPLPRLPGGRSTDESFDPRVKLIAVPYRTFPGAGRRGTTVIDRSTAYPLFGLRAGGVALDLVREKKIDIVHGLGASVLGYARKRAAKRPVFAVWASGRVCCGPTLRRWPCSRTCRCAPSDEGLLP